MLHKLIEECSMLTDRSRKKDPEETVYIVLFQIPGLVNVDFADVKAVMKDSGTAMLGVGVSSSKNRAEEAAEQATLAPLIGSSIQSATGVVYNITGGKDITLQEVNRVSQVQYFCLGLLCFASIGYILYLVQSFLMYSGFL